jgi:hypothetical protein
MGHPNVLCGVCGRKFFGDIYFEIDELQDDIVEHMLEEHGIIFKPTPDLTWRDLFLRCPMPERIPPVDDDDPERFP